MKITIIWISYFLLVLGISIFAGIKTGERVKIYLLTEAGHNELCQKIFNEIAINHGTAAALIWDYDQMRNSQDVDIDLHNSKYWVEKNEVIKHYISIPPLCAFASLCFFLIFGCYIQLIWQNYIRLFLPRYC